MRLIFHNPHVNYAGNMLFNWVLRCPQHHKYAFLWKEAMRRQDASVGFLIDGCQSSFYQTAFFKKSIGRFLFLLKIFSRIEFWIWLRLNNIPRHKVKIFYHLRSLDPDQDVIFSVGFTSHESSLQSFNGIVFVHLSHYHLDTELIAKFVNSLKHPICIGENDATNNPYFHHYFPNVSKVYLLPFTYNPDRFKNELPFENRILKCFASGPSNAPTSNSYVQFFGKNVALNPMRELIFDNKERIKDAVAAFIFRHQDALKELKEILPTDVWWKRPLKRLLPVWLLKILFNYQSPYLRFDIVQKYNEYAMFACPEERTGFPSLKMFEGMLCGSALVAIDHPMYTSIGFRDGENFISYRENDLEDMLEKIRYYQQHPESLERICSQGYAFAQSAFSPERVFETFWKDAEKLLQNLLEKKEEEFVCSFLQ